MRRRNDAVNIKTILKKISKNPKLKKRLEETEVLEKVNLILGDNLKKYISNKYIKNGILHLHLKSYVLRNELSYQKQDLINRLNDRSNKKIIKEIIFK